MEFNADLAGPSMTVAFGQLQSNTKAYVPVLAGGTLGFTVLDLAAAGSDSGEPPLFVYALVSMFITMLASAAAWKALSGQDPRVPIPILGYFLAGIVSGAATALGFVLLILPGLYLLGRWGLYIIALQVEEAKAMDSLGRSWELTERDWLAVTVVAVLAGLANFGGAATVELLAGEGWFTLLIGALIGNAIATAGTVWGCIATVALYRFITGSASQVDKIFG